MTTLVLATRNQHKTQEIRAILGDDFHCLSLADLPPAPEVIEDASTFAGNAAKKASSLAAWLVAGRANPAIAALSMPLFVLADDSGLEVDALHGKPGVHSARFAALDTGEPGNSSDSANNAKLLRLLLTVPSTRRGARFRCVMALVEVTPAEASPKVEFFDGACEGRILESSHGAGGFGYDPLFQPQGHDQSFAQLGDAVKNRISHRSLALAKLKDYFQV